MTQSPSLEDPSKGFCVLRLRCFVPDLAREHTNRRKKTLYIVGGVGSRTLRTCLVKLPPAPKLEIRWGRTRKEAVLKTPIGTRTELHRAVGVDLYAR
jgi:hypothetical protein